MQIKCPYCDRLVQIPDEYRDETITCPHCRRPIIAHPDDPSPSGPPPRPQSFSRPVYGIFTGLIGLGLFLLGLGSLIVADTDAGQIVATIVFALGVVVLAIARLMDGLADIVIELRRLNAHHKSPS